MAEDLEVTERTVMRLWRVLEAAGFLGIVEPGRTADHLPLINGERGNLARCYVLAVPANVSPAVPHVVGLNPLRTHARDETDTDASGDSLSPPSAVPAPGHWPASANPRQGGERLAAAQTLRRSSVVLRRMSARMLRHLLMSCFVAGWSPSDVLWALDHLPSGHRHLHTDDVRIPDAWLRSRLAHWSQDGQVLPGHRDQLEARAIEHRARVRADRDRWTTTTAPTGPNAEYLAARARLKARSW